MFDSLSDRLTDIFRRLNGRGRLSKDDVEEGLREVRRALLEADVNVKIARSFVERIHDRAVGTDVLDSLTPGQQLVKIVNDELVALLGGTSQKIIYSSTPPTVLMLIGLQGSGKTTTSEKLARVIRSDGHRPILVGADVYRPAAGEQLAVLAGQDNFPVVVPRTGELPLAVCKRGIGEAARLGCDVVILDTAGRLQIDEQMLEELRQLRKSLRIDQSILVLDAMTGQEALAVGKRFSEEIGITGVVLTKMDGDARGGAALSMRETIRVPIMFCGVGERPDALEPFYPERVASRILGMGDVLTMIEKAQQNIDARDAAEMEQRLMAGSFSLDDFLFQMRQLRKMGPLEGLLAMIPNGAQIMKQAGSRMPSEKDLARVEAIICAMTVRERKNPEIIDGDRRRRIANGSGVAVSEINRLLKDFHQMQAMMKKMGNVRGGKGGLYRTAKAMRQLKGMDMTGMLPRDLK